MKNKIVATLVTVASLAPMAVLAFNAGAIPNAAPGLTVNGLIDIMFSILWPVAVAFFIIMFMLAAFSFFTAHGDEGELATARNFVLWGVVGVIVALLAFSIPFIVRNTLGNGI